jgi:hypothetical protein
MSSGPVSGTKPPASRSATSASCSDKRINRRRPRRAIATSSGFAPTASSSSTVIVTPVGDAMSCATRRRNWVDKCRERSSFIGAGTTSARRAVPLLGGETSSV